MDIARFLEDVRRIFDMGAATEHSYRPALQALLCAIAPEVEALNEPRRIKCGAPDFLVSQRDIVIGHLEAKDINIDIRKMKDANKAQKDRYRAALPNLIYTNCLDWDFYREGELVASVSIADLLMGIQPRPENFETLEELLKTFASERPQSITTPKDLAQRMAGKAGLIKDVMSKTLAEDQDQQSELAAQFQAFQENLIHDIAAEDFADIYAETIAYGLFAARLHDTSQGTFTRQKALELLPKSNPFLRKLFTYVAGYDLDDRIAWIIDDLARVFQAADLAGIMEGFGKFTGQNDPFLHFYETFLAAYNPDKRKSRGVWYTPEAVVNFIVRAVDEVLQTEFGLPDGLADTSKVTIDWETGQTDKKGKPLVTKKDVHRVQILDPATGTGTFLAEVIKQIAPRIKMIAPDLWSSYIEEHLIPRLHGFEILMASYAMCHMKLDMILTELGYQPLRDKRLSIYLTNSLEEGEPANQTLPFAQWISDEAKGANEIKRDMPIMCVIGNPPYLGEGGISDGWMGQLMEDYKKEPGGKVKLQERNPKWLNDLYVKFIRLSSHLIDKNGEGVLGFITNHGYLDNPTFRGMRWHLLKSFDKIWVLDLHGNSKKKEVTPEGHPDKNVFDIQQGVSILIAVRKKDSGDGLAKIHHGDLWGKREGKYKALGEATLTGPVFTPLESPAPQHPFVRRDFAAQEKYEQGFSVNDLMLVNSVGIVTARDSLTIGDDRDQLWQRVQDFAALEPEAARGKYKLEKDVRDWRVGWAQNDLNSDLSEDKLTKIAYRPFDTRWTYYTGKSRGFLCYPRGDVMRHMLYENVAILTTKAHRDDRFAHANVTAHISEVINLSPRTASNSIVFPLYLYPSPDDLDQTRRVNFEPKLYRKMQKLSAHPTHGMPDEVAVFDYIYGVLHCPAWRETYAEFLKIDFPRIPWPSGPELFWDISAKGTALRRLHLMEAEAIGKAPYPFRTVEGEAAGSVVDKPGFHDGKVWINKSQYFDNAPEIAWNFYIGGYQPAQKWLKDRKGRTLGFEDVKHYQQILKILAETDHLMQTITMDFG